MGKTDEYNAKATKKALKMDNAKIKAEASKLKADTKE